MKLKIKCCLFLLSLNLISFGILNYGFPHLSMLTGQFGLNSALAWQIVGLVNSGMSVWGILALFAGTNIIGVGVLYAVKRMLKELSTGVVVAW